MYRVKTRDLTLNAMLSAVVAIGTIAIAIPVPVTGGFINLGDGIILTVAFLLGGHFAVIAGALGSALADILLGYAQWAPFSLVIKGAMGYAAIKLMDKAKSPFSLQNLIAVIVAEAIMIGGYYLSGSLLMSSFIVSLQEIPANMVQALGALCIFLVLSQGMTKFAGKK